MRVSELAKIGIFLGFLYFGMVLILVFGDTRTISNSENRTLAKWPSWSLSALWKGYYLRALENYAADHIAFRDALVDASRAVASWHGLSGEAGTYIIASQANNNAESTIVPPPQNILLPDVSSSPLSVLTASPTPTNNKTQEETGRVIGKVLLFKNQAMNIYSYIPAYGKVYAETINRFEETMTSQSGGQIRVFALLAPTAVEFVQSSLLQKLSSSQQNAIHAIYRQINQSVTTVDALTMLHSHAAEALYFRTDHHWTATGAYYAYAAFMNAMGISPVPLSNYHTEQVTGFLGSLYSATLSKKLQATPDKIILYKPYVKHEYIVHYEGPLKMNLLDMSHALKQNKYRIFLSGDRPWGRITTETDNERRIAVIKDSFGNAFVPFLLPHYKEIYIIDPRQFNQPLVEFIIKHHINEVLFLNNIEVTNDASFTDLIQKLTK